MLKNYLSSGKGWLSSILFLSVVLTSNFEVKAQTAKSFTFEKSQQTYQSLEDPVIVKTATNTSSIDDNVINLPEGTIPFGVQLGGNTYTGFRLYENGFISFGTSGTSTSSPLSSSNGSSFVIAPYAKDLVGLYKLADNKIAKISYKAFEDLPVKKFVIEWTNFSHYTSGGIGANYFDLNFQLIISEDGTISFHYNIQAVGNPSSNTAGVGLRGATVLDFNSRKSLGTEESNWSNSVASTSNSDTSTINALFGLPESGLLYTFLPPGNCVVPSLNANDLVLNNAGVVINGSFNTANSTADSFLVVRTLYGTTPNAPVNGVNYSLGQNESLNGYVVTNTNVNTFTDNYNTGVRGNTKYSYFVYAFNKDCLNGPVYLTDEILTNDVVNCPIALNGMQSNNVQTDSFTLTWPIGENGNALPMQRVIEVSLTEDFSQLIDGAPFILNAEDLSLVITGLTPNTKYFYRAKNVTSLCESSYSSVSSLFTSCIATDFINENFNASLQFPNCWSKILVGPSSSVPTINVSSTYAISAPYSVTFYGNGADLSDLNNKAILVSPTLTNVGAQTHRLRFSAKMSAASGTHQIQVVALSNNTAEAQIQVIETIPNSMLSVDAREFIVNFDQYSGNYSYIGIRRTHGSTYSYLAVDDIIWEPIPTCPELSNVTVSNPTINSFTASWEDSLGTPAMGYQYYVSTSSNLPAQDATFLTTMNNSVVIDGLAYGTYTIFVRRVCSEDDFSPFRQATITILPSAPAPWTEEFLTNTFPVGWINGAGTSGTSFTLGNVRGATGTGETSRNIYKNIYANQPTVMATTLPVGPLNSTNYELSFYYKQSAYANPYTPLTEWGGFIVEVSKDFGVTWQTLGEVTNEIGTGDYIQKNYSLQDFQGEYVQIKITATRTAGDFDISFDLFEIKEVITIANPTEIIVSTQNELPATITEENGTLQLMATVTPTEASQEVVWSIADGSSVATISENGLVTALANGTVTVIATSVVDATILGLLEIVIDYPVVIEPICEAVEIFTEGFEEFTSFYENCWTVSNDSTVTIVEDAGNNAVAFNPNADNNAILITPELLTLNGTYFISFDILSVQGNNLIQLGTLSDPTDITTFVPFGEAFVVTNGNYASEAITAPEGHNYVAIQVISENGSVIIDNITWAEFTASTPSFGIDAISVYPNPVASTLSIVTTSEIVNVEVYSLTGQLITSSNLTTINVEGIASGIYVVKVTAKNKAITTLKFVKK